MPAVFQGIVLFTERMIFNSSAEACSVPPSGNGENDDNEDAEHSKHV